MSRLRFLYSHPPLARIADPPGVNTDFSTSGTHQTQPLLKMSITGRFIEVWGQELFFSRESSSRH
jgi:hypothetical protein